MLWIDFVNSDARDPLGRGSGQDRLENPDWMLQLADRWQLRPVQIRSHQERDRLRRLRRILAGIVQSIVRRESVSLRDVQSLNQYLTAQPVRPQLEEREGTFRVELVSAATGVDAWLFAVADSFAQFLASEDPTRLKICANADCGWVFYDSTRSRTRRWCAASCGDLIKVREFRQRQKRRKRTSR